MTGTSVLARFFQSAPDPAPTPVRRSRASPPASTEPTTSPSTSSQQQQQQQQQQPNSSSSRSDEAQRIPTYGYHNTFHTHATPGQASPLAHPYVANPTLDTANSFLDTSMDILPPYECTVELDGILNLKAELASPFQLAFDQTWHELYILLRGTSFNLHRVKTPGLLSKDRTPVPGKLLRSYSLQHAEVGLAVDFKKPGLQPRSPFAHLLPPSSWQKLYETDPHLFFPIKEHVLRLRIETQQFLVCCNTQEELLDWVEKISAAIDISQPLEDRCEPRYRSLPRRNRRQRMLDPAAIGNLESIPQGRQIIAEQERIFRQLYPNLGESTSEPMDASSSDAAAEAADAAVSASNVDASAPPAEIQVATESGGAHVDLDADDLDPADVRFPTASFMPRHRRNSSSFAAVLVDGDGAASRTPPPPSHSRRGSAPSIANGDHRPSSPAEAIDPKARSRHSRPDMMRYRRRCAPMLLASSPRASDVVWCEGERMRINLKQMQLVSFEMHPPRYESHGFPKSGEAVELSEVSIGAIPAASSPPDVEQHATPALDEAIATPLSQASDDAVLGITATHDEAPHNSQTSASEDLSLQDSDIDRITPTRDQDAGSFTEPPSPTISLSLTMSATNQLKLDPNSPATLKEQHSPEAGPRESRRLSNVLNSMRLKRRANGERSGHRRTRSNSSVSVVSGVVGTVV